MVDFVGRLASAHRTDTVRRRSHGCLAAIVIVAAHGVFNSLAVIVGRALDRVRDPRQVLGDASPELFVHNELVILAPALSLLPIGADEVITVWLRSDEVHAYLRLFVAVKVLKAVFFRPVLRRRSTVVS